jgi:hypothetical protein
MISARERAGKRTAAVIRRRSLDVFFIVEMRELKFAAVRPVMAS